MTGSLTDLLSKVWFDHIVEIINILYFQYLAEVSAFVSVIVLILLMLRIRKKRRAKFDSKNIDQHQRKEDAPLDVKQTDRVAVDYKKDDERDKSDEGLVRRLKNGLQKTRRTLADRIDSVLLESGVSDSKTIEEIEEALITSDVGVNTTMELIEEIKKNSSSFSDADDLRKFLKTRILDFLTHPKNTDSSVKPCVIMVVGVNGVGKTTTIGKLAYRYNSEGKKVLIGAADTFRAAAVEQLEIWAQRAGSDIISHRENADPSAVAFDAVEAGISRKKDVVIIDTAGRLQTKVNLMEQLKKIKRSIEKKMPGAPHEVLLVLDATTGQNAISQAKIFYEGIGVTSLVLTKLDGTARGGIVISICNTMKLPLQYIGTGEGIDDFQPFDPEKFIEAIF